MKINTNEWLNMVEDFILPSFGAEMGQGWVLIKDNGPSHTAKKELEWYEATLHEPGEEQFSCQDRQDRHNTRQTTHTNKKNTLQHPTGIGRVIFQPTCSPDLNPLDTWAWNATKRDIFTVCNRTSLKAEAARAWAGVRSWQLVWRLLRDGEERLISCVAAKGGAFEHSSTDSRELCMEKFYRDSDKHSLTIIYLTSRTKTLK